MQYDYRTHIHSQYLSIVKDVHMSHQNIILWNLIAEALTIKMSPFFPRELSLLSLRPASHSPTR